MKFIMSLEFIRWIFSKSDTIEERLRKLKNQFGCMDGKKNGKY